MKNSKLKNLRIDLPSAFARVASVALFVSVLSVGSVAQAASIPILRNVTTGDTIFTDDFESYTVLDGNPGSVPPGATTAGLPNGAVPNGASVAAQTGTWSAGGDAGGLLNYAEKVVDQSRSANGVIAQQGSQFFQISTAGINQGTAMNGNGVVVPYTAGDIIEANIAFYMATGSTEAYFYLYDGSALLNAMRLNGDNNASTNWSLSAFDSTGAPAQGGFQDQVGPSFTPDAWNTLNVVHEIGTSDWEISFNGDALNAVTVEGYQDSSSFFVDSIYLHQAAPSSVYFDAVIPEPSSILLMGLGVLSMVVIGRRRKSRR